MTNRPVSGNYLQGNPNTHPGMPIGNDRVPAWLAPNEFVVNAEATQMYGPQIEAMNNHGRAVQQGAGVPPVVPEATYLEAGGFVDMFNQVMGGGQPVPAAPQVMSQVPEMQAPPVAQSADLFSGNNWARYSDTVASIESGGLENPYSIYGGANDHYVGKYQLGSAAIKDASRLLGIENAPSRETVRKDPALQERLFNAYTQGNHQSLMSRSPEYQNMDAAGRQRMLGYAHNQGAGGASEFLRTGTEGRDAFGTSGLKYANAIGAVQGDPAWAPLTQGVGTTPAQAGQMFPAGQPVEAGVPNADLYDDWMGLSMGTPTGPQAPAYLPQVPAFSPPVNGGLNKVFSDPTYKMMADRSGLGAQGYWDSLQPQAQAQHTDRVNAGPAVYTSRSEMDVGNRVGANSGLAAGGDYNLAQTGFGREGMPTEMTVPMIDQTPQMPGADADLVTVMPNQLEVPGMGSAPANSYEPFNPNAVQDAYKQYGESRMDADYQSQQELDQITMQLQTTTRDAPAYEFLHQRRAQLLQNLGRKDPSYTGSSVPTPEALGADILSNQNNAVNAEAEVAAQTQAIQDAAVRGDIPALSKAETALKAAHQQSADTKVEAEDMSRIRRENAVEDQARKNSAIQTEVSNLDAALAAAQTPEGISALTAARDAKVAQLDMPPMPPAGQTADGIPTIDSSVPPAPKTTAPTAEAVETKIAEAEATVETGDTVLDNTPTETVEKAGAQAIAEDPSVLSGAFSSLKDFFGDMFDIDELKRMAILYAGARISGAGHGSSLAFAGKSYLSRLGANEKAYKDAAASGKYTKQSVAKFKRSKDPNDLAIVRVAPIATGTIKTYWDKDGAAVSLEKYKSGDNASWVNTEGQTVDPRTLSATEPKSAYNVRRSIEADIGPMATEFYKVNGTFEERVGDKTKTVNKVQVGPATIVNQAARFAMANGYNVEDLDRTGILNKAMMDMFNDKSPGAKSDITPYLEMNNMRFESSQREGMFSIGRNEDGGATMVSPSVLQVVNAVAVAEVRDTPGNEKLSKQEILTQVYSAAWADFNNPEKVSPAEREQWGKKSSDDTNGFIEYFKSLAE